MRFRFIKHDSPLATAVFTFTAGSLTDPKGQEGISHYLEHVLLDASGQYPDEVAVSNAFAGLGARTNGGTGFCSVSYYGTCRASKLAEMVAIHCDLVATPLLRDEDVEREGKIIMSELRDGLDDAMSVFWYDTLDSALGWPPIIGHESSVPSITPEQIREHYARHYGKSNLMVTVCATASAEDEIRRGLDALPAAAPTRPAGPTVCLGDLAISKPQFGQACLAVLAPTSIGQSSHFRENLVASVTANCLGGPDFSMLFRRIRGELGLTYWIGCGGLAWEAAGMAYVMSQFEPSLMGQVQAEVRDVLRKAVDGGVPEETVGFAKDAMLTAAAGAYETTGGRARQFESYHVAGAPGIPASYSEYEALVLSVAPADVDAHVRRAYAPMLDPAACKTVTMNAPTGP